MAEVATLEQLASALGVARSTIQRWRKEGLPPKRNGTWNTDDVLRWRRERGDARSKDEPPAPAAAADANLAAHHEGRHWRNETARLRSERLALELAQLQRELVRREHVEAAFRARADALDRLLATLARRVAKRGAGAAEQDLYRIVHDETREIVRLYSLREGLEEITRRADGDLAGFDVEGDD